MSEILKKKESVQGVSHVERKKNLVFLSSIDGIPDEEPIIPDADEGGGEDFHDIDTNVQTAFELHEARSRGQADRDSLMLELRLPSDDEDLRPPLPDYHDERWPLDSL